MCPSCGEKAFKHYVSESGEIAGNTYGRCDRECKCGYHLYPPKDGTVSDFTPVIKEPQPEVYLPQAILFHTLARQFNSNFAKNLKQFDIAETFRLYKIGFYNRTGTNYVTFPYINQDSEVTAIQCVNYDKSNHRKTQNWIHSLLEKHYAQEFSKTPAFLANYLAQDTKVHTLFGMHLIHQFPEANIAIVEAPKTAIYANLWLGTPEKTGIIWLAAGALGWLKSEYLDILHNRNVLLIPDLSTDGKAFNKWKAKAIGRENVRMFTFFEEIATFEQRHEGHDLADFLDALSIQKKRTYYCDKESFLYRFGAALLKAFAK